MQNNSPHEVKDKEEKGSGSQFDVLSRIFPGLIVVWLGISLFLKEQDILNRGDWWAYFLLGLGFIFLFEAFVRMMGSQHSQRFMGKLIAGVVLATIGASSIIGLENWWPLILIGVGIVFILVNLQQRNE